MPKFKWTKLWFLVLALLVLNLILVVASNQVRPRKFAELHFFDVGQGDSIYLRTIEGNDVLIDGGPGDIVLSKLGRVMPFSDRKIELMILTHPHADHVAGLVEVLKRFEVDKVLVSDLFYGTETYKRFLELLEEKQVEVIRPKLGQRIFLDNQTVLDVLYPINGKFDPLPSDPNDASTLIRLSFGKINVFLTGDAGREIESLLVSLDIPLESEILKIGHHGSRHSSQADFIAAVDPDYAVIQVGKNSYGHPHEEVVGALEQSDLELLRTDEQGDIVFELYPDRIELINSKF